MLKSVLSVSVYRVSFSMCWGFYTTGTVLCIFIHTFGPIFLQCWLSETGRSNEHHADGLVSIPQIYLSPHTCIHVLRKSHLTPPPHHTHTHTHTHACTNAMHIFKSCFHLARSQCKQMPGAQARNSQVLSHRKWCGHLKSHLDHCC